jgi:hypothetical protein
MRKLLIDHNLKIASEWHPTKNGDLRVADFKSGSEKKVWWLCSSDPRHEWQTAIRARAHQGNGCPYCSGRSVLPENSIAALHPELAREFDVEKNAPLTADSIAPQSNRRVWWRCSRDQNHSWQIVVMQRVLDGSGCPLCRKLSTSLASQAPEIAKEWHPSKNGDVTPADVTNRSTKSYWFLCPNGHEWKSMIRARTIEGKKCAFCYPTRPANKSLSVTHPEVAKEWDFENNRGETPDTVRAGSQYRAFWICSNNSEHQWQSQVRYRTLKGRGCPDCGKTRPNSGVTSESNSLAVLYPNLCCEWHQEKNGELRPEGVSPGSGQNVWWKCEKDPEHLWRARVFQRVKGSGCPFCSGFRPDAKSSLATTHPKLAAQWHPSQNGELTPNDVSYGSSRKAWWQCAKKKSHVWNARIQNRANGRGCPICAYEQAPLSYAAALEESIESNTAFRNTFDVGLNSLAQLACISTGNDTTQQSLYRLVHAGVVATLETYLSDAFINTVLPSELLRNRLLRTTPHFKERNYSVEDVIAWSDNAKVKIKEYLLTLIYHNLFIVQLMYGSVLRIEFPDKTLMIDLQKAIDFRHDVVHRNGKDKSGFVHALSVSAIENTIRNARLFVNHIDKQLQCEVWKRRKKKH